MAATTPSDPGKIRIVHIIQNLHYGGMERILHSIAQRLPSHGFEVHIVALEFFGRFSEGLEGRVKLHQVGRMPRFSLLRPGKLVDLLKQIQPDVVHSHSGVWLKGARAARLAGVPVFVHTEHGRPDPVPLRDRISDYCASRWTDMVIAVSDPLAQVLRSQVLPRDTRLEVLPNGIAPVTPLSPPERDAIRAQIGIPSGSPVLGSVGRLEPVKNYRLALEALAALPSLPRPWGDPVLVLAGDGSERAALQARAVELGLSDRVRFLGWRDDAERLYGIFDIFCLTSLSEGTSVSLLEAMAMANCPVVTDVGGNRAVLGPELECLIVQSGDATALAQAWFRLLTDPELRLTLGIRARHRVLTAFAVDHMVKSLASWYRELLSGTTLGMRALPGPILKGMAQ